jgi:cytosine/adenosine deaminase-related metal-dependent hydrolase
MTEADIAMEKEGIVAVGDISNSGLSAPVKKNSRLIYRTFIETLGLNPAKADEIFAKARNLKQDFERCGLQASITPHAPYSLSEELFKLSVDEGNRSGTVSIHNKESADESELFETKRGAMRTLFGKDLDGFLPEYENPSHRILKYIASDARLLLVHNTYANGQDVEQANRCNKKTTWVICPGSNLYIENRLPDIDLLLKHGAHIAVGTDSLSSNTCLSILNELKILNRFFPETSLQNLLRWATLNGAQALGFDSVLGSFDKGKRPGALLLSGIDFHNMRLTDKSKVRRLI